MPLRPGRPTGAIPPAQPTDLLEAQPASSPSPHELDLGLEFGVEATFHLGPRPFDQLRHVRGGGTALVDYEVAVQLGDDRGALAQALQSCGLHEPAGRVA